MPKPVETFENAGITELEVSWPGFGFGTIMPSDYVERAVDCGTYGTITVKAIFDRCCNNKGWPVLPV